MNVFIADDDIVSQKITQRYLSSWGYTVDTANDGEEAYTYLMQQEIPDPLIILLDWVMPGKDGLEILKALKASDHAFGIYVIMVTSKSHGEEIAIALDHGADDYLRKPFHRRELEARLNVGVRTLQNESQLITKNKQLDRYGVKMQELAEQRALQLVHADRMATLGVMSAGIAHEINNSSSFISGNVQTLGRVWDRLIQSLDQMLRDQPEQLPDKQLVEFVIDEVPSMLQGMREGVSRIHSIVKGLSEYSRDDRGDCVQIDLAKCVEKAMVICAHRTKHVSQVHIDKQPLKGKVLGIGNQIEQVLVNLLSNASDALENVPESRIDITIRQIGNIAQICVSDNGPGVKPEAIDHIFDPFYTTKGIGKGTGLGLAISSKIMSKHNGQFYLDTTYTKGACFVLALPIEDSEVLS
ncbi:response regulator [bacterium AH-315-I18]|nr:response regulator [bacterium AH-315-I18]